MPEGEARLMQDCRRSQEARASRAKRERRVFSGGTPANQFTTRWTLIAAAVTACCRLVLAKPQQRERRKSKARIPCESVPAMPARTSYSALPSIVRIFVLAADQASCCSRGRSTMLRGAVRQRVHKERAGHCLPSLR